MRIMFIYGPFSTGQRPFDFENLGQSPRGLTGSEVSCFRYALAMARRGHAVTLAVAQPGLGSREWRGMRLVDLKDADVEHQDAVYSWNEPDMLRGVPAGTLRLCNQQLNDFSYAAAGWQDHVDVMTSPSAHHAAYLRSLPGAFAGRWEVMPNGCEPGEYELNIRLNDPYDAPHSTSTEILVERPSEIPGRVMWASSSDRGLHLLLQVWPEVKRRVPHASLRAYYHWSSDGLIGHEQVNHSIGVGPDICELAQRARYIRYGFEKLRGLDVVHVGSVSRDGIRRAFEEAEVLGFPCDTIRYTEGFSVTTLEGCASGALPVICGEDALGQIYGGAVPMVEPPVAARLAEYAKLLVRALTDRAWADEWRLKARALAERHSWAVLADRLERAMEKHVGGKRFGYDDPPPGWNGGAVIDTNPPIYVPPGSPIEVPSTPTGAAIDGSRYVVGEIKPGEGGWAHEPVPDISRFGRGVVETYVNQNGHLVTRWSPWPGVLVGGWFMDAADWSRVHDSFGVRAVINAMAEPSNDAEIVPAEMLLQCGVPDDGTPLPREYVLGAISHARAALAAGGAVYIHCALGASRSPAFAYAVLRGAFGQPPERALAAIRSGGQVWGETYGDHPVHRSYLDSIEAAIAQGSP